MDTKVKSQLISTTAFGLILLAATEFNSALYVLATFNILSFVVMIFGLLAIFALLVASPSEMESLWKGGKHEAIVGVVYWLFYLLSIGLFYFKGWFGNSLLAFLAIVFGAFIIGIAYSFRKDVG